MAHSCVRFRDPILAVNMVTFIQTLARTGVDLAFVASDSNCMRFRENMFIKPLRLKTIDNTTVMVPDGQHLIHIQFRRFAGCPVCNLHIQSFLKRRNEIENANVREVIFFHSFREELMVYASDFPFFIVADPTKQLYKEFGVEPSLMSLLHPKALIAIFKGVSFSLYQTIVQGKKIPPLFPYGGSFGKPADFLIDKTGKIVAGKYGKHAYDQWSVDELLELISNYNTD